MKENIIIRNKYNVTWDNLVVHKIDGFPYGVITQYYICDECMYLHIIDADSVNYALRVHVNINDITSVEDLVRDLYDSYYGKITTNVSVDCIHYLEEKSKFQIELEAAVKKIYRLEVFSTRTIQIAAESIPVHTDAMKLYDECRSFFSSRYDYVTDYLRPYAALLTPKAISVVLSAMSFYQNKSCDYPRIVAMFVDICNGLIDANGYMHSDNASILMIPSLKIDEINILFRKGIYTIKDWREYESRYKL